MPSPAPYAPGTRLVCPGHSCTVQAVADTPAGPDLVLAFPPTDVWNRRVPVRRVPVWCTTHPAWGWRAVETSEAGNERKPAPGKHLGAIVAAPEP